MGAAPPVSGEGLMGADGAEVAGRDKTLDTFPLCRNFVDIGETMRTELNGLNIPFDYAFLLGQLKEYSRPRDKITQLLSKGEIIRIKKGLYISGGARNTLLREILAGMIKGPSYISLEYALAWYQMIPEQVKTVTCITTQKPREYHTPVGSFRYQHIRQGPYRLGLEYIRGEEGGFWIASREKALCDLVYFRYKIISKTAMDEFLLADLRLDWGELKRLSASRISSWGKIYGNSGVACLADYLKKAGR
jgi:hypothetical protein